MDKDKVTADAAENGTLSDEDLATVVGGTGGMQQLTQYDLQQTYQDQQQAISTISNIMKEVHDDAETIIQNLKP